MAFKRVLALKSYAEKFCNSRCV